MISPIASPAMDGRQANKTRSGKLEEGDDRIRHLSELHARLTKASNAYHTEYSICSS